MKFIGRLNSTSYTIDLDRLINNTYILMIDDTRYEVKVIFSYKNYTIVMINNFIKRVIYFSFNNSTLSLSINNNFLSIYIDTLEKYKLNNIISKKSNLNDGKVVNIYSPMPGDIKDIGIKKGDKIIPSDVLFIIESMKMENEVQSKFSGEIKEIFVKSNMSIENNTLLASIIIKN